MKAKTKRFMIERGRKEMKNAKIFHKWLMNMREIITLEE